MNKLLLTINSFVLALVLISSANSLPTLPIQLTKLTGADEQLVVDTRQIGTGETAIVTSGITQIEQLFGEPADGITWFFIGDRFDADGVGNSGDTVTVTIAAAPSPLDLVYPAVSVVTTVTPAMVADASPERALSLQICTDLDGDANFSSAWKCSVMKDFSGVFINSKLFNEWGERTGCIPITDCFNVTTTGTTVVDVAFNTIERRGLGTELQRSPNDPRLGTLNVAGSFVQQPGGTGDLLFEELVDGGSPSMIVDGSITPIAFRINCDPVDDKYITKIRWYAACNGPKLDTWLCANSALSGPGVIWTVRSEANDLVLLPIKSTNDWKNKFAIGDGPGTSFRIDQQQGEDSITAELTFPSAAIIKKCGTNGTGTDDYIEAQVNDDLTGAGGGNVSELESFVFGFRRTP